MPTIRLTAYSVGPLLALAHPPGARPVPRVQLRCLLRVPGTPIPRDAILDTGAPLTCFPERIWQPFREGVDFEWCPFAPGVQPPAGQMAGWRFTFRMARFLVPLAARSKHNPVDLGILVLR